MSKPTQQTKPIEPKLSIPVVNGCAPLNAIDIVESESNRVKQPHRFKAGNKAAVGHKRGRQRLTGAFVDDLAAEWDRRGAQALTDLDGKALVQACIAILPKDVLVSMNQDQAIRWVINASPRLSEDEWRQQHGLNTIEQDENG